MDDDRRAAMWQLAAVAAAVLVQKWAFDQSFRWTVRAWAERMRALLVAPQPSPPVVPEWFVREETSRVITEAERLTKEEV